MRIPGFSERREIINRANYATQIAVNEGESLEWAMKLEGALPTGVHPEFLEAVKTHMKTAYNSWTTRYKLRNQQNNTKKERVLARSTKTILTESLDWGLIGATLGVPFGLIGATIGAITLGVGGATREIQTRGRAALNINMEDLEKRTRAYDFEAHLNSDAWSNPYIPENETRVPTRSIYKQIVIPA